MHRTKLLALLRCPEDHTALTPIDDVTLRQLNEAIRSGRINNRGGRVIEETLEIALLRAAGDIVYPIAHGIPLLLRDEGILLSQLRHDDKTNRAE
ncbi:MAG: hypothetical protein U0805_18335 [Pirellulales bacterium]